MAVRWSLVVFLGAAFSIGSRHMALANGAFPESLQILLPADRPHQIVLATNFGLIISDDDGASWSWTCEQRETLNGSLYAVGPSPADRFFGLSVLQGLAYSDDDSCSWRLAAGALTLANAQDFFPDPVDPSRVLAIGSLPRDGGKVDQLYVSQDGGATFGDAIFTAPTDGALLGVETARASPNVIYVALYTTSSTAPSIHPKLARSIDGGGTWTTFDLEEPLGPNKFRIIAVDPVAGGTIYLRVYNPEVETVAVSRDGGLTFAKPISVPGGLITAFARLASGTVLVGAIADPTGLGFRSTDGGVTFQSWPGAPHLRALAEREGRLYVAARNYTDGWAIGVSTDEGVHIQPLTTYEKVAGIRACAKVACEDSCDMQAGGGVWPAAVCHPPPPTPPSKSGCAVGELGSGIAPALLAAAGACLLGLRRALRRRRP